MTMLLTGPPRRYGYIIASLLLVLLYFWTYLGRPTYIPSRVSWNSYSNTGDSTSDLSDHAVPDLFDIEPFQEGTITKICSEKEWTDGLLFTCDKSFGGIGNLRNSILICVRYAIEAGASLVIPGIVMRNASDISDTMKGERTDMDYVFNKPHFVKTLGSECPQLNLYESASDWPHFNSLQSSDPIPLLPEDILGDGSFPRTGVEHPEEFRQQLHNWLKSEAYIEDISVLKVAPAIVALKRSYLSYPIYSDGTSFALNFGRILRIRDDARALALKTLQALCAKYSLPTEIMNPNPSNPIPANGFFGAHLRTEKDAVEGWPVKDPMWHVGRYDNQSIFYLEQISSGNLSIIYVASGNTTEVSRFAGDAASYKGRHFTVTTKFDLLTGRDLEVLNGFTWDQQALVDFLVMQRASDFAGVAHSSFAWNIALHRHRWSKVTNFLDGPQMLSDEYSQIYGEPRAYPEYAACMWP